MGRKPYNITNNSLLPGFSPKTTEYISAQTNKLRTLKITEHKTDITQQVRHTRTLLPRKTPLTSITPVKWFQQLESLSRQPQHATIYFLYYNEVRS